MDMEMELALIEAMEDAWLGEQELTEMQWEKTEWEESDYVA